jgi:hypothetical protein
VGKLDAIYSGANTLAFRGSQTYLVATGAYTIFTVSGGAIEAISLIGRITGAAVGATTIAGTLNGVAGDAGAVACNGAVGTLVYYPLNVGGTTVNAASVPKTVATLTSMVVGTSAGGTIVMTYAVGTSLTMEWALVYRKLSPYSVVNPS